MINTMIRLMLVVLILGISITVSGNNIQVTNIRMLSQDTMNNFTLVEFDISWENSWRYTGGPGNWDAAWIFIKYRVGAGPWLHAWLNNTGHTSCASTTIANGLLNPGDPFNPTTNPVLGVFLYRSAAGSGTFDCQNVQLRWNYGANELADNSQVDIKVFAIEHVYIPSGSFWVGSGGTESGAFYTYPTTTNAYQITSEASITVGTAAGNLYYSNVSNFSGDQIGPIPAPYPKGYTAFYIMKYEISQQGYVDFLNTLTRAQQINRVRIDVSGTNIVNKFVMCSSNLPVSRNGISCRTTIPGQPAPIEFICDLSNNNIGGELNDGQGIPCNYMAFGDVEAYMDWAGLRLMTEFEYEKSGRGPLSPVPNEYAWGNNIIYAHSTLVNSGLPSEVPGENYANIAGGNSFGPLRNGAFARTNSDRTLSGSGYYGCMELSGSVNERGVSVGNPQGRSYTGFHGNGLLSSDGYSNVPNWPASNSFGSFLRGGSFNYANEGSALSLRSTAAIPNFNATLNEGGRGVRTAP